MPQMRPRAPPEARLCAAGLLARQDGLRHLHHPGHPAVEEKAAWADVVITGEGRLDRQTVMGKVPAGVAEAAKRHGALVVALAGCVTPEARTCNDHGIDAYFPSSSALHGAGGHGAVSGVCQPGSHCGPGLSPDHRLRNMEGQFMKIVIWTAIRTNPGDLSWGELEKLGELTVYDRTSLTDEEEIIARIADADVVLTNKTPSPAGPSTPAPPCASSPCWPPATTWWTWPTQRKRASPFPTCRCTAPSPSASSPSPCCWRSATTSATTTRRADAQVAWLKEHVGEELVLK